MLGGLSILRDAAESHPSADVVFADYKLIDADGQALESEESMATALRLRRDYATTPRFGFDDLLSYGNFVPGGCTLVRTEFVKRRVARFDEQLGNAEDYDFWLELGPECRYFFVDERAWDYRVLATSKFHSAGASQLLRCELMAIGRHRSGASARTRARSVVQAAHRSKRQWAKAPAESRVGFGEVARLVETPRWALAAGTVVAVVDSVGQALARRGSMFFG